jgi:hypothetical protein
MDSPVKPENDEKKPMLYHHACNGERPTPSVTPLRW